MRYLIIEVDSNGIHVSEWKPDQPDDECKYCESFNSWSDLFKFVGEDLEGYAWIEIR